MDHSGVSLAEAVSLGDLQHPQSPEEPIVLHISGAPALDTDAVVELNAAVALGMSTTLEAALEWIARIEQGGELARYHLLAASKADLLRRLGRRDEAAASYREAIELATNPAERRYLERRMAECARRSPCDHGSCSSPRSSAD